MPTATMASAGQSRQVGHINVVRLVVATAATAGVVFVLCWLGTFVPFSSPTHADISLFTNADVGSGKALAEGTCWSLLFGALVGGVFAVTYNATASLFRD